MANPFEIVVQKLIDLGFYDFLFPFIITSAIFFALLKKSKLLGDSVVINGVLALSVAFLIFGFPVIVGFALGTPLSTFFTQATVWILVFAVGFLLASFFYPDLEKLLAEQFTKRTTLWALVGVGVALFLTSGLVQVFTQGLTAPPKPGEPPGPPTDVLLITAALGIFLVLIIIATSVVRGI